jgi:predicted neutral ceramidase superfamily lipid hydrolase
LGGWIVGAAKMDIEFQRILVIILGGAFIWGVTILMGIITLRTQGSMHLKSGFFAAFTSGVILSLFYPLAIWTFQSENDIPGFVNKLPELILIFFAMMLFGFLLLAWRSWSLDWTNRWLMRWVERRLKEREQKNRTTAKK